MSVSCQLGACVHNSDFIAKIRADNFNKEQDRFCNKKSALHFS